MNQLTGFVILLFAALPLIVSSVTVKVTAQSNGTISSPIEVKKLPSTEEKKESAGECRSGQVKDWAGICFKESEAKACPTCAPGSAAAIEKPVEYKIKKPASPTNPTWLSQDCHRTVGGKLLCLTTPANPRGGAYESGAKKLAEDYAANPNKVLDISNADAACAIFGNDLATKQCLAGYSDAIHNLMANPVATRLKCNVLPAGTATNGIGSAYGVLGKENEKCVPR